jgi:hypothetical protein
MQSDSLPAIGGQHLAELPPSGGATQFAREGERGPQPRGAREGDWNPLAVPKNLFHNDLSLRQQTIAQAKCMKAR